MYYLGIDPGLDGALALLNPIGEVGFLLDTPTLEIRNGKKKKRIINLAALRDHLTIDDIHLKTFAAIEKVHSGVFFKSKKAGNASAGVVSSFTFGQGFGQWQGMLAALQISTEEVLPQQWKKIMMDGMGKEKDASIARALQLYPKADLKLKKHHGRADALLIATWLYRTLKGAGKDAFEVLHAIP